MRSIAFFVASLVLAFTQAATAQDIPARVARLAYTQGAVSVYQDPELGWDKAYVNTPVTSENSVWTDRGARAEVRVGGIAVRLDGETQFDVSRLDEDDFDAGVARGSINVRVRYKERNDHITLNTPQALFILDGDGRYRLDVDEDRDQARLTVFSGHAQMQGAQGNVPVAPGRMIIVSGGQYGMEQARAEEFDRWADARDRQWTDSNARNYVSYDMTGYEELDRYGSWAQDPDYGSVWYPTQVNAGWAPYRYGHWSYVRPWGWTWIDDAPWGYAPSHYGRWVQVRNRWAWAPGYTAREHPLWAPALVGFIGGAGFSVSVSAGSAPVGWYPLAPWERYQPWYHTSTAYVTRVNHYVVDRRPRWAQGQGDEWRHWNRDRAATVVNRDVFVSRRPVQNSLVRVAPETIRSAPIVSGEAVAQRVLPQRNELARFHSEQRGNVNVAAPTVMRSRTQPAAPQVSAAAPQQQQVVRPEFRRRGSAPAVVAAPAGQQPPVSAPAPQAQQPQNPAARVDRAQQQRQAEEAARAQAQQSRAAQEAMQRQNAQAAETQRRREEAAQRAAQDTARREQQQRQQQGEGQRQAQEQQQRAAEAQRQQQEQAQRAARDEQQRQERANRDAQQQQQRQAEQQRRQQEQAQRDAQQQQQQQQQRAAQEAQQRQAQQAAETQRKREEAAQRAAQDDARRAQAQAQRQQQEQAQRQQQEQQRAAQQQQQQQKQAEQQRQQANPAARAEKKEEKKDDKDKKDKDKDKQ